MGKYVTADFQKFDIAQNVKLSAKYFQKIIKEACLDLQFKVVTATLLKTTFLKN